ncbi:hypothetical protein J6590_080827 [Homalodisca vitripennis]|nr:hypothetical protein J6590_080827 [Homalodisca vitripennis]
MWMLREGVSGDFAPQLQPLGQAPTNVSKCYSSDISATKKITQWTTDLLSRRWQFHLSFHNRQSALIDKIQNFQLELEANEHGRISSSSIKIDVAIGCDISHQHDADPQTELSFNVPSFECKQCEKEKQRVKYYEDSNFHFQIELAAFKSKYEDLLKQHEVLLQAQEREKRNDDSLIDKILVIADDIPIIKRYDVLREPKIHDTHSKDGQNRSEERLKTKRKRNRKKKDASKHSSVSFKQNIIQRDIFDPAVDTTMNTADGVCEVTMCSQPKKLYVFGESHAKNISGIFQRKVPHSVFVCGSSNVSSDYILKNAKSTAESLTKNDTTVLIVSTNDVSNCTRRHDRPAVTLPGHLLRFIRANQYNNWVVDSLPHRFDLPPRCYTIKLVNQVNHRLKVPN